MREILQKLPLATTDFDALRSAGEIYVDKTVLIAQLIEDRRKFVITRPRRFGKTLLVSVFKTLFSRGLKDYGGLAIEKSGLWHDKTYPVVHLDFSRLKEFLSVKDFRWGVQSKIGRGFLPLGFRYDPTRYIGFFDQWEDWLRTLAPSSYVLLVDECDTPLTAQLNDLETFKCVRSVLGQFYSVLKATESQLRFLFIAGITQFRPTDDIFSESAVADDVTFESEYSTLLGFEGDEINRYFSEYVRRAARVLSLSESDITERLLQYYGGYCFDARAIGKVCNPWSVLHFLDRPQDGFDNYWTATGGQSALQRLAVSDPLLTDPAHCLSLKYIGRRSLQVSQDDEAMADAALLTQSGYLTVKDVQGGDFCVGFPNKEVASAFGKFCTEKWLGGESLNGIGAGDVAAVLGAGNPVKAVEVFNRLFSVLDGRRYPLHDESACRGCLQALLTGADGCSKMDVYRPRGRSDLEVFVGRKHWVFEFEYSPDNGTSFEATAERFLDDAADRLRHRWCAEGSFSGDEELIRVAAVFSEAKGGLVRWQRV